MLAETQLAAYLSKKSEQLGAAALTPQDNACLSGFRTNSMTALAVSMFGTGLLGWRAIDPKLLLARPPRVAAFAGQFALVSGFAFVAAFYSTRFTSIQCTACLMACDSALGEEARSAIYKVGINQNSFWELAKQIAKDAAAKELVERKRVEAVEMIEKEKAEKEAVQAAKSE